MQNKTFSLQANNGIKRQALAEDHHTDTPCATRSIPRRGLNRLEAAMYVGISPGKFDELIRTRRMPNPRRIDRRKIWDVHELDLAFDDLPSEGNSWDDV
jgi:hypothetical protein